MRVNIEVVLFRKSIPGLINIFHIEVNRLRFTITYCKNFNHLLISVSIWNYYRRKVFKLNNKKH